MSTAAGAMDQLRSTGRTLHFEADAKLRRVRIEMRDLEGNVLRAVTPSEAMAIAGGRMAE